ncbi:MAG: MarR family transcriptional regulator [Armatimonadota bacterium]|nr:MarR family transcriptional regulator [Armatimonadota bacterium]MDR7426937.1 MarR family transcriptional regulator [Armatimonadota bacterium]MDR7465424.1 MarR family transcriptional regulator [Armatimonadota bacterium]MDR7474202.1 MarR family transcriptional regulator [Armatimonadota bacterium]MDR7539306.1 MarR family transcriptional regulator [Armatimonadota bacterium]
MTTGLMKVGLALKHQAWRQAARRGLSPTQAQILTLLVASDRELRLAEVAYRLAVAAATASEAVDTLVRKGLVDKKRDAADGRAVAVRLTAAGRKAADCVAGWPDFLLQAAGALTPPEQAVFLRGLTKMIRMLQERGQIPVARMCVTCRFFQPNVHRDSDRPHHCAFVDAPFGDRHLRLDCPDHQPADARQRNEAWKRFATAEPGPEFHHRAEPKPEAVTGKARLLKGGMKR